MVDLNSSELLLSDRELADLADDLILLTPHGLPSCQTCRHFDPYSGIRCAAFPNGIPLPIQDGQVDHRNPVQGDHGIQYEQRLPRDPDADPTEVEALIREQLALRQRLGVGSVPATRTVERSVALSGGRQLP
jgi:hypothetical protein